jgi:hypothetical protein
MLQLHRTDDWYAVWRLFEGERDLGWYVGARVEHLARLRR